MLPSLTLIAKSAHPVASVSLQSLEDPEPTLWNPLWTVWFSEQFTRDQKVTLTREAILPFPLKPAYLSARRWKIQNGAKGSLGQSYPVLIKLSALSPFQTVAMSIWLDQRNCVILSANLLSVWLSRTLSMVFHSTQWKNWGIFIDMYNFISI